jgi:ketosteroid isomerase-like protein
VPRIKSKVDGTDLDKAVADMPPQTRPSQRWLSGFGALDWRTDERAYAALLDALTRDRLEVEGVEREMQATALRGLHDVQEEQQRAERSELAEARRELDDFRAAMTDVRQRGNPDGQAEVSYDSRDPEQNAAADVLIQYLVRPGYADVRTDEPQPGQYVYYIMLDWPRLRALAEAQGHPIPL